MPPESSAEAIKILAEWRGLTAAQELEGAIESLSSEVARQCAGIISGAIKHLETVTDLIGRRSVYCRRHGRLAQILNVPAVKQPDDSIDDAVRLLASSARPANLQADLADGIALVTRQLGGLETELGAIAVIAQEDQHYRGAGDESIGPWLQSQAEKLGGEVRRLRQLLNPRIPGQETVPFQELTAEFGHLLTDATKNASGVRRNRWQQDAILESIDAVLLRRTALSNRLAVLNSDQTKTQAMVGKRVKAAVADVGEKAVINGIMSARALQGPKPQPTLETQIETIEADVQRLADSGVTTGPAVDSLKARIADVKARTETIAVERRNRARAAAGALLVSATAGQESGRADLERLCQTVPAAFPTGFAEAIASARADLALLAELA